LSELGERLKLIRQEHSLTQTQVANLVGIRPQHINGIERGSKTPSDLLIKSICRELGIQEEWLCHGQEPIYTPIEKEMIKIMASYFRRAFIEKCIKLTQKE
jgi:transcriptional regulator with XRE-family HTH domain